MRPENRQSYHSNILVVTHLLHSLNSTLWQRKVLTNIRLKLTYQYCLNLSSFLPLEFLPRMLMLPKLLRFIKAHTSASPSSASMKPVLNPDEDPQRDVFYFRGDTFPSGYCNGNASLLR